MNTSQWLFAPLSCIVAQCSIWSHRYTYIGYGIMQFVGTRTHMHLYAHLSKQNSMTKLQKKYKTVGIQYSHLTKTTSFPNFGLHMYLHIHPKNDWNGHTGKFFFQCFIFTQHPKIHTNTHGILAAQKKTELSSSCKMFQSMPVVSFSNFASDF